MLLDIQVGIFINVFLRGNVNRLESSETWTFFCNDLFISITLRAYDVKFCPPNLLPLKTIFFVGDTDFETDSMLTPTTLYFYAV